MNRNVDFSLVHVLGVNRPQVMTSFVFVCVCVFVCMRVSVCPCMNVYVCVC